MRACAGGGPASLTSSLITSLKSSNFMAAGEMTLGQIRGTAHGAASPTPVHERWWQVIRWRDGQCIWWRKWRPASATKSDLTSDARWLAMDELEASVLQSPRACIDSDCSRPS